MNLEKYLTIPYVDGGRDIAVGLDCWGLARHVLHEDFGCPLFESFASVTRSSPDQMTAGYCESVDAFSLCEPKAGAVACCFYGDNETEMPVFHHVGVCINDYQVLHTSSKKGASIVSIRAFKRLAMNVKFYEYKDSK